MWFKAVAPAAIVSAALITGCSSTAGAPVQPVAEVPVAAVAETPTPVATPEPSAPSPADTVPTGKWKYSDVVTKVGGAAKSWWDPVPKKGDKSTGDPWEFSSTCTATECTGKITRKSDKEDGGVPAREFTWDGKTLVITRPTQKGSGTCETDGVENGDHWSWQRKWVYDKVKVDLDASGQPTRIQTEVTVSVKDTTKAGANCGTLFKPATEVSLAVLTPG